jgi:uncharacterized membrane protein
MKKITRIFLAVCAFFMSTTLSAQPEVEMADTMRSEGKIYVVIAIMVLIFLGLIGYLVSIDRKVSRLEKKWPEKKG